MHVLLTCKNEDDSIKHGGARVVSQHFSHYESMGIFPANSAVLSPIWPNFELVRDFTVVLRRDVNEELKFLGKFTKRNLGGGEGQGDVNEELKFLGKFTQKKIGRGWGEGQE